MRIAIFGSALFLAFTGLASILPDEVSVETITERDIRQQMSFLASDEMRGRAINTPFNRIAARYLAHRFEAMGLEPAGDQGYFHSFELMESSLGEENHARLRSAGRTRPLEIGKDFFPSPFSAIGQASGELAFVGYGISAPEFGYDDYRSIDATGKIVVVFNHEPRERDPESPFSGVVETDHGREFEKILNAQRHGAVGVIIVNDPVNHSGDTGFARLQRSAWPASASRARPKLKFRIESITIPALFLSMSNSDWIFQQAGLVAADLQEHIDATLDPSSRTLTGLSAALVVDINRTSFKVDNVLATLPGSDSILAEEVVVIGAHFDHVAGEGDHVFNGADDDASGTVGLLEVAEAFVAAPVPPRRRIVFAAFNAEERGLLGSYYYVHRPPFPLEKTVAMLQMDMIGRDEEVPTGGGNRFRGLQPQQAAENRNAVNILGYSHSQDLRRTAENANSKIGLDVRFRYDNNELGLLRRSDNWPFLTRQVPSLFFHTGLHPDYHRTTDTLDKINYGKMEKIVRLVFLTGWRIANDSKAPRFHQMKNGDRR